MDLKVVEKLGWPYGSFIKEVWPVPAQAAKNRVRQGPLLTSADSIYRSPMAEVIDDQGVEEFR